MTWSPDHRDQRGLGVLLRGHPAADPRQPQGGISQSLPLRSGPQPYFLIFTAPENFVFCRQDGASLNPDVLRKDVLYPVLDRLNIPRPKGTAGFHAFRNAAASLINAETGNLKITQKFLGHSNVSTTADIYTHTSESMEREAAVALERSIFGSCSRFVRELEPRTRIQ